MKKIIIAVLTFTFMLGASPAFAHKVVSSTWLDGNDIEGEVGFSNGEYAPEGSQVDVLDAQGNKLGETKINGEGLFRFTPTQNIDHHFHVNLGAGHVAKAVTRKGELPDHLKETAGVAPRTPPSPSTTDTAVSTALPSAAMMDEAALKSMIGKIVRQEIQPLRREIASYKEKNNLQTILGGLGYILGLTGIFFFIQARRQMKQKAG